MKRQMIISIALTLLFPTVLNAFDPEKSGLISPDTRLLGWAEGDLNKDGREDLALALEKFGGSEKEQRSVQILLRNVDGTFSLKLEAREALLLSSEGGMMGEPFESLTIKSNSLFLSFSGGSRERWTEAFQFQFRNSGWFLIGLEITVYDSLNLDYTKNSYNYLTGKIQKLESLEEQPEKETWSSFDKSALISLENFRASDDYSK